MISLSVYLCARNESLENVLSSLGIAPTYISTYAKGASHLEAEENGALVTQVQGYFTHVVDLDLFNWLLDDAISAFEALSKRGVEVAMPVEEEDDPEIYHLWRAGKKLLVRIDEDDDILRVLDPLGDAGLQ